MILNTGFFVRSLSKESKHCVLLLPRHATSFHKLKKLALALDEAGTIKPIFVLATPEMQEMRSELSSEGLEAVLVTGHVSRSTSMLDAFFNWLPSDFPDRHDRAGNWFLISLYFLEKTRRALFLEYDCFVGLIRKLKPIAVLVPGDRELSPVPAFLRAARDSSVPSIIAFSGVPDPDSIAVLRAGKSRFSVNLRKLPPLLNFLAMFLYPKHVRITQFGALLFSPGWRILAHAWAGMLSSNPWVQGGGLSEYVFYQDERRMRTAMSLGVDPAKCLLTGEVELDEIHAAYLQRRKVRKQILQKYEVTNDRPLLLFSVPNDAEHNFCQWDLHLNRTAAILENLKKAGYNALLSLHPKSDIKDYRAILNDPGHRVVEEPLSKILPAFDLYVCALSSTAQWAIACDVPVVNIDLYGANDPDFSRPGIATTKSTEGVAAAVTELLNDRLLIEERKSYSKTLRDEILFDGNSRKRIIQLLEQLQEVKFRVRQPNVGEMAGAAQ